MIASDSSTMIAFFDEEYDAKDVKILIDALERGLLALPPFVLTELLSARHLNPLLVKRLHSMQLMDIMPGFWVRAANDRSVLLRKNLKARLADTMIARCCIDSRIPLITRDSDFCHFQKYCGLTLL
jgi:predicted nucleic acid-binding protein